MAWLLIPVYSGSFEASSGGKTSAKPKYLVRIEVRALFATNIAICTLQKGWTSPFWVLLGHLRAAMWTTKISCSGSRAVATNSFFPTSSTHLVVERTSSMIYNLHQSSLFRKLMFALLRVKKGISKITSGLMFAIKKIF